MRTKHFNLQLLFVLLCFCSTVLSASDLTVRLKTIQAISQIQPIESKCFSEKYVIKFRHPVDYNDPEGMTFEQRVVIGHVGFDRPTVIVTEGYGGAWEACQRGQGFLLEVDNEKPRGEPRQAAFGCRDG